MECKLKQCTLNHINEYMQSYYYVGLVNEKKNVYFNHVQIFDYTIFNTNMRSALQLCKKTLNVQFLAM